MHDPLASSLVLRLRCCACALPAAAPPTRRAKCTASATPSRRPASRSPGASCAARPKRRPPSSSASSPIPRRTRGIAVVGIDPFTQARAAMLPPTPTAGSIDVRVPRAHFADFPRTEFRLYASEPRARRRRPRWSSSISACPTRRPSSPTRRSSRPISPIASRGRAGAGSKRHDARRTRAPARPFGAEARGDRAATFARAPTSCATGRSASTACSRAGCALAARALAGTRRACRQRRRLSARLRPRRR